MDVIFHCFAPMTIGQTLCKCTAIIIIITCLGGTALLVRHISAYWVIVWYDRGEWSCDVTEECDVIEDCDRVVWQRRVIVWCDRGEWSCDAIEQSDRVMWQRSDRVMWSKSVIVWCDRGAWSCGMIEECDRVTWPRSVIVWCDRRVWSCDVTEERDRVMWPRSDVVVRCDGGVWCGRGEWLCDVVEGSDRLVWSECVMWSRSVTVCGSSWWNDWLLRLDRVEYRRSWLWVRQSFCAVVRPCRCTAPWALCNRTET